MRSMEINFVYGKLENLLHLKCLSVQCQYMYTCIIVEFMGLLMYGGHTNIMHLVS